MQTVRTTRGGLAFLPILVALVAALALSGNAMADTGVPCAATGMESVSTPRDHYQAGEIATISGGGFASVCDVQVDVERPDGVTESFTATTDLSGNFALDYQVPPPPGVTGQYRVVVRGLNGAELASMTFEDAPAPQFDIAPSHVPTTGSRVFTAVVRNTANAAADTARCIRITTPGSVTVSSASFVAASPTTTGPWTLTTGANFVQLRSSGAGVFGSATSSNNWVRFEITANAAAAGTNTWTARMTTPNADCASGGSSDQLSVSVAQVLPRQYTAEFRDTTTDGALLVPPTVVEDASQAYRIRITRTAGGDDLQHIAIALPTCFTTITSVSTTDSGPPAYTAELTDNMFRLIPNTKLAANGEWVQVHFTATADCPTGAHDFRTAAWKNTSPETGQGDIFQLSPGTGHPTLTVLSANVAPVASGDAYTVNEDTTLNVPAPGVLGNDVDTQPLTAVLVSTTTNGTLTLNSNGSFSYVPSANFAGTDTFTYKANDGSLESNVATVTITVSAVDDPPTAVADTATLGEDSGANAIDVLANDTDIDGGPKSVDSVTQGQDGSVAITGGGSGLSYTPNANYCGPDSFTYTLNGGSTATVSVTVECVNDAPAAADDTASGTEDTNVVIDPADLLANDSDADAGDTLTVTAVGSASGGSVSFNDDGEIVFVPDPNLCGVDAAGFEYTVEDEAGASDTATVTISLTCVDDPPTAVGDSATVVEDSGANAIDVLANDTDIDGGPKSVDSVTQGAHGSVAITGGGTGVSYTPDADYCGPDSFTYTLNGGSTATISITVSCVNDEPTAAGDAATVAEDDATGVLVDVLANDSAGPNESGQTLTITAVGSPSHGTAVVESGQIRYTPTEADYNGSDSFSYTITDNGQTNGADDFKSDSSTVSVAITAVNDAPSFTKGADQTVAEDSDAQAVAGWATGISAGPSDESGQSVDFLVANDNNALFSAQPAVSSNGTLTYTAGANAFGVAAVTVRAHDDGGTAHGGDDTSAPQTFTITVTAVNDAPDAVDDSGSVDEDDATGVLVDVLANDSAGPNESGQTLTITAVGSPSHGTAVIESGKIRYTPTEANYNGPDSFTYTIRDNGQTNGADDFKSDTATVNITVRPVNDAPAVAANTSSVTVNEGQTATNTGTWSDVDGDNVTLTASRGTVTKNAGGTWSWSEATTDDVPPTTVTITANDGNGGTAQATFSLTVNNVPPTLTSLTPSSYLVLKGTSVTVTGTYTDPGTGDTFTCVVNWDEPTGTPENTSGGAASCSPSHTYTAQGTYTVSMKVRDDNGGESNTLTVIITVYDPGAGGFVTGGGWINSPAGSYAAGPSASGRANFGFNSQYKKGASIPTGETEFQLHFATFNFHSEAYEVLVVSGHKAQYRGTGKVNGVTGYKFVLTAYDGQISGGGGADKFRIKITRVADGVVVYDTKMGVSEDMDLADPLALGGGSIVIHKAK